MNVDWAYNWGIEPKHNVADAHFEFVPMIWSASVGGVQSQINRVLALEDDFGIDIDYVLGFNEPELPTQANMTVQQALDTWDIMTDGFAGSGLKLVSPSVSGAGARALDNWLYPFMDEVNLRNADADPANDLQVDAIAYHYYTVGFNATTEANKILTAIDGIWNKYQKPIWLTEFAGINFDGVADVAQKVQFNTDLLEILIPAFESRSYVERYAWWQFGSAGKAYSQLSSNSAGVYTPTSIGEVYAGTTLESGESYDFSAGESRDSDVHYLRGGTLTNTGVSLDTALRSIDALDGDSSINGSGDWGLAGGADTFVRVRAGATLRKQGSNSVRWKGAAVTNDGTLRATTGTLGLENGTNVSGVGSMHIDSGGTVSFGAAGDTAGSRITQSLELHGGAIQTNSIASGLNTITGSTTVHTTSTFSGNGDLTISGPLRAPSGGGGGGITKTGSGTLYLTGNNTYNGLTNIQSGTVLVASPVGSATRAVQVNATGTLGGVGSVGGSVTAFGGTVAPGVSQSNLGLASVPAINEGVVVDAINFDFTGVQDDAPLTQTSTLNPALKLVSGFDFGPGVNPRNAANNGNEFNVAGFSAGGAYSVARTDDDYVTFTVEPVAGLAMVLEDVTYDLRRNGSGAATHYRVMTSIDGYEYADRLTPDFAIPDSDTTTRTFTATYGGSEAVTEPVEVRLYGWNADNSFGNTHIRNVSLDASFVSDPDHVAFDPIGVLELNGNYAQFDFATLEIELGGTSNADPNNAQFDQLQVTGNVTLDGTLDLAFADGFAGSIGDTFDIVTANSVSGMFDTVNAPAGMAVTVSYLEALVRVELTAFLLPGDFNNDGTVDAADFVVWRDNLGAADESSLMGNGNGSNGVDQGDYNLWASNFGSTSPSLSSFAVPEPSSIGMIMVMMTALVTGVRRRKVTFR